MRSLARTIVALALVAGPGSALAQEAPHPELDAAELEFLDLINEYRQQSGLGELVATVSLNRASDRHSYDMASNDWFDHTGSDGSDPSERCAWAGYPEGCAENIAAGYPSAQDVFEGWRSSWGHNANMLGDYQAIGIALEEGGGYGSYWTTDFGWTIDEPYDPGADPDPEPDPDPDPGADPDPEPDPDPDPGADPDPDPAPDPDPSDPGGSDPAPLPDSWGGFGDQCLDGDQCATKACVVVDATQGYCTRSCASSTCPYAYECQDTASGSFCFFAGAGPPPTGPAADLQASGTFATTCSVTPARGHRSLLLVVVLALALTRRRRNL